MPDTRFTLRRERLDWRMVEGEVVVLDLARSEYVAVNRTGSTLWRLLDEGATQDELEAQLAHHFDVSTSRAAADVSAFLDALRDRDLLVTDVTA